MLTFKHIFFNIITIRCCIFLEQCTSTSDKPRQATSFDHVDISSRKMDLHHNVLQDEYAESLIELTDAFIERSPIDFSETPIMEVVYEKGSLTTEKNFGDDIIERDISTPNLLRSRSRLEIQSEKQNIRNLNTTKIYSNINSEVLYGDSSLQIEARKPPINAPVNTSRNESTREINTRDRHNFQYTSPSANTSGSHFSNFQPSGMSTENIQESRRKNSTAIPLSPIEPIDNVIFNSNGVHVPVIHANKSVESFRPRSPPVDHIKGVSQTNNVTTVLGIVGTLLLIGLIFAMAYSVQKCLSRPNIYRENNSTRIAVASDSFVAVDAPPNRPENRKLFRSGRLHDMLPNNGKGINAEPTTTWSTMSSIVGGLCPLLSHEDQSPFTSGCQDEHTDTVSATWVESEEANSGLSSSNPVSHTVWVTERAVNVGDERGSTDNTLSYPTSDCELDRLSASLSNGLREKLSELKQYGDPVSHANDEISIDSQLKSTPSISTPNATWTVTCSRSNTSSNMLGDTSSYDRVIYVADGASTENTGIVFRAHQDLHSDESETSSPEFLVHVATDECVIRHTEFVSPNVSQDTNTLLSDKNCTRASGSTAEMIELERPKVSQSTPLMIDLNRTDVKTATSLYVTPRVKSNSSVMRSKSLNIATLKELNSTKVPSFCTIRDAQQNGSTLKTTELTSESSDELIESRIESNNESRSFAGGIRSNPSVESPQLHSMSVDHLSVLTTVVDGTIGVPLGNGTVVTDVAVNACANQHNTAEIEEIVNRNVIVDTKSDIASNCSKFHDSLDKDGDERVKIFPESNSSQFLSDIHKIYQLITPDASFLKHYGNACYLNVVQSQVELVDSDWSIDKSSISDCSTPNVGDVNTHLSCESTSITQVEQSNPEQKMHNARDGKSTDDVSFENSNSTLYLSLTNQGSNKDLCNTDGSTSSEGDNQEYRQIVRNKNAENLSKRLLHGHFNYNRLHSEHIASDDRLLVFNRSRNDYIIQPTVKSPVNVDARENNTEIPGAGTQLVVQGIRGESPTNSTTDPTSSTGSFTYKTLLHPLLNWFVGKKDPQQTDTVDNSNNEEQSANESAEFNRFSDQ